MPTPIIADYTLLPRLAAERRAEFEAMREAIEFDGALNDDALDALVESLAAPIIAVVDCTQCANCCRSLDVCLVPDDIPRLASALLIAPDDVMTRYADRERGAAQEEWAVVPEHPCPFLGGTLCTIYADRPHACRLYPQFTPDFRYNLEDTIEGASTCPIIYNVLVALAERVEPLPYDEGDES
ncbi:MAG: YkgJ family cysteine cluster protein [Anaerolineae bacterium]|nr:YkgJ family cysteine cluster protein [Anaerolineae bacterium]